MSRCPVHVRDASPDDAGALVQVWAGLASRSCTREAQPSPVVEAAAAAARIAALPDQRLLVGVLDGTVVGAVHLILAPLSPIHTEQAVHLSHLHVLPEFRKHGVGKAMVEAALDWAEDTDAPHLLAAASAGSRDANRFMSRLGLTQVAVLRGALVSTLRSKLPVHPPAAACVGNRNSRSVGQVIAQRRSMRRAQSRAAG
jgi:GNAT superfamily N-acetyltransferase